MAQHITHKGTIYIGSTSTTFEEMGYPFNTKTTRRRKHGGEIKKNNEQ